MDERTVPPPRRPDRTPAELEGWVTARLADLLGIPARTIDVEERFQHYGLDSARATGLVAALGAELKRALPATLLWDYPSVAEVARYLAGAADTPTFRQSDVPPPTEAAEPIAVVGLACRFPLAPNPEAFWRLLFDGVDAITVAPADRWSVDAYFDADPATPGKMSTRWGGFLDQVAGFDAEFFGISPREAPQVDPQQRLMLELAWEALEDAGLPADTLRGGRNGVFVGAMWSDYARQAQACPEAITSHTAAGQDLSVIAGRISYTLGWQGPSLTVNTACSSALTAVHLSCQSLRAGEASLCLAGGVNLILAPESTVAMSKFGAMAPDGRSKAFDARANGYVRGEGGGLVVLKPLSRALADGDRVYCLIRGSALNNDGFSNGLTAPNPRAQEAVLREAYARAGVAPREVAYVEAHGTGTPLGDPIEVKALGAVLGDGRPVDRPLLIGSVKTNIGHLEAAAGIAGLIKVALALHHRVIPASLHFDQPNPHIPFADLGVAVARSRRAWPAGEGPALAGVSSFGFSGTNCHVVLEAAPADPAHLLLLSAPDPVARRSLAETLEAAITPETPWPELCGAAAADLSDREYRLALPARSSAGAIAALRHFCQGDSPPGLSTGRRGPRRKIVFVLPGQGSQWPGMGRALLAEPAFRAALERCDDAIRREAGWSPVTEILSDAGRSRLNRVEIVQPTLFAIEVALATLWQAWGVRPDAVVGHSLGEVAAAHLAGCLGLDDAARIVCGRSRLMGRVAGRGAMAVVALPATEARAALADCPDLVTVAASNSPRSTVLSGDPAALDAVLAQLVDRGVFVQRVKVDVASHSPQMDEVCAELGPLLSGVQPQLGSIPLYSTVTGQPAPGRALDAGYWLRNLRNPVLFDQAVRRALADDHAIFLEVSPHPILVPALREILEEAGAAGLALPSLRRDEDSRLALLESLGTLYTLGQAAPQGHLYPPGAPRLPLPPALMAAPVGSSPSEALTEAHLLPLSAHTPEALRDLARATLDLVSGPEAPPPGDLCFTAARRRQHQAHRLAGVFREPGELITALEAYLRGESGPGLATGRRPLGDRSRIAFVCPGQGSQWWGMGRQLLAEEPVFRSAIDRFDRHLEPALGWSIADRLTATPERAQLDQIGVVQPVLCGLTIALAALWRHWGIEPQAIVGHSQGEVAAAHLAGALSLAEAVQVIATRSRLLQRLSGHGAMAVVELPAEEARAVLAGREDRLAVAAFNGPTTTVLSGDPATLTDLLADLERREVFVRPISVDVASHSPQVDVLLDDLRDALGNLHPGPTEIPFYSTVSGGVAAGTSLDGAYWARNLREPVRFAPAILGLIEAGHTIFLELSPHPALLPAIRQGLRQADRDGLALGSLHREQDELASLLDTLAQLYARGVPIKWDRLFPLGGRHVRLPTTPWQRERFWAGDGAAITPPAVPDRPTGSAGGLHGRYTRVAGPVDLHVWEARLDPDVLARLDGHRVMDCAVLPISAYLALVQTAATAAFGAHAYRLSDLRFGQALFPPEAGNYLIQVSLVIDGPGEATFGLYSRAEANGRPVEADWSLHVTGTLGHPSLNPGREPVGAGD